MPGMKISASGDNAEGGVAGKGASEKPLTTAAGCATSRNMAARSFSLFCFLVRGRLARADGTAGKPTRPAAAAGGGACGEGHVRVAMALRESASAVRSRRAAGRRPAEDAKPAAQWAASAVALAASITFFAASGAMCVE